MQSSPPNEDGGQFYQALVNFSFLPKTLGGIPIWRGGGLKFFALFFFGGGGGGGGGLLLLLFFVGGGGGGGGGVATEFSPLRFTTVDSSHQIFIPPPKVNFPH